MSKLKGIKKLNKAVSAQIAPFGIVKATLSDDYSYLFEDNIVTFKITEDIEDEYFTSFIEDRFNFKDENPFLTSIFHEIGHAKTWDVLTDEILDFCFAEKDRINDQMLIASTKEEVEKLEWQYFNLPDEIMATAWAIDYMRTHPKKIKKMWKKIHEALNIFYQKNNVTE